MNGDGIMEDWAFDLKMGVLDDVFTELTHWQLTSKQSDTLIKKLKSKTITIELTKTKAIGRINPHTKGTLEWHIWNNWKRFNK